MVQTRKKICLLISSAVPGINNSRIIDWLEQMPELNIVADIEPVLVFNQEAVNIGPAVWIKLAEEIKKRLNQFSGFVVLHGTDNLLYTSSALSFLLPNINKPVVFTGGPSQMGTKQPGLKANLINALQVASFNFGEVCLMFGNRLLRANQSSQTKEESLNIFSAPNNATIGRIDFSIRIFEKLVRQSKGPVKLFNKLDTNIEIIEINPFIDFKSLTKIVSGRDGIIINAGCCQNFPEALLSLFEKIDRDIPIVVWSQVIQGPVLGLKNLILINNLTWPAATVKFMWVLSQVRSVVKVKELMSKDVAGEIMNL